MAKYRISFIALAESTIDVEADNPEEALIQAGADFDYPVTKAGDTYELLDWEARADVEWLDTSSTPQQRLKEHVVKIDD